MRIDDIINELQQIKNNYRNVKVMIEHDDSVGLKAITEIIELKTDTYYDLDNCNKEVKFVNVLSGIRKIKPDKW